MLLLFVSFGLHVFLVFVVLPDLPLCPRIYILFSIPVKLKFLFYLFSPFSLFCLFLFILIFLVLPVLTFL
ncbi:hypothetical protein GGR56DRAFT_654108 [Xylariaceae sp. FL0804]|nr:hypothetical protein GGR56DRAFT_654108 [Xylariaceae sp. FL0804]